jgi:menaquinone-dependent protoporphyrinogen oxidase
MPEPTHDQIPIFYASSEGRTGGSPSSSRCCFARTGSRARAIDVTSPQGGRLRLDAGQGVLVGASLHIGKHQGAAARFVRSRPSAERHPSAFFSVSLECRLEESGGGGDGATNREDFCVAAGWTPIASSGRRAAGVFEIWLADALDDAADARKEGGPTDTSRDHELTDWTAVSSLADIVRQAAHLAS